MVGATGNELGRLVAADGFGETSIGKSREVGWSVRREWEREGWEREGPSLRNGRLGVG